MNILLIIIFLVVFYYIIIVRKGNLSFWQLVAKYPNVALGFFLKNEDSWFVDNCSSDQDKKKLEIGEWDGPFQVMIPNMDNKLVKVYGKVGKYEESQKQFKDLIKLKDK